MRNTCPTCKGYNWVLRGDITFGHGDSTHDCYVVCKKCGYESEKVGDWGWPTDKTFRKALDKFQAIKK